MNPLLSLEHASLHPDLSLHLRPSKLQVGKMPWFREDLSKQRRSTLGDETHMKNDHLAAAFQLQVICEGWMIANEIFWYLIKHDTLSVPPDFEDTGIFWTSSSSPSSWVHHPCFITTGACASEVKKLRPASWTSYGPKGKKGNVSLDAGGMWRHIKSHQITYIRSYQTGQSWKLRMRKHFWANDWPMVLEYGTSNLLLSANARLKVDWNANFCST